jgi:Lipoprotein LpqB beta-propeller domain/Sporulation and spore germination
MRLRSLLGTLAALVTVALSVAGCVSMPTGGPVQSYPVTQGTAGQSQQYMQIQPTPPASGWDPQQIVEGFLTASASFGNYPQVAYQYLTPQAQKTWKPDWNALVYKTGPTPEGPAYAPNAKNPTTASVAISGTIQASLRGSGSYSVPSASSQTAVFNVPNPFTLTKVGGQWRISSAPQELLLTSNAFKHDYQLQNLYFFDPAGRYLVPDPIYVPLGPSAQGLVNVLVSDLITPPNDWLGAGKRGGATKTAFPAGTTIGSVDLNGVTAVVNLKGTAITKANSQTMGQVSAQLLLTLQGAVPSGSNGPAVTSVEVLRNGKPWTPPTGQGNPVQQPSMYTAYNPPTGSSSKFYYVDSAGYLAWRPSTGSPEHRLEKIGTQYSQDSQIAVSPDGRYVAALYGQTLYAGAVGGQLLERATGYVAMSWDSSDNLWASTNGAIVMFRHVAGGPQPLGSAVPVKVLNQITESYTALKVAPDGVRIAIVQAYGILTFGAISGQQGPNPQISLSTVQDDATGLTPSSIVNFTGLAWYGPDKVITLATPGPAVTVYPVSGGGPTSVPTDPDMTSISASYGEPLIGLVKGLIASEPNLTGSWTPLADGDTSVTGSSPTYPG